MDKSAAKEPRSPRPQKGETDYWIHENVVPAWRTGNVGGRPACLARGAPRRELIEARHSLPLADRVQTEDAS